MDYLIFRNGCQYYFRLINSIFGNPWSPWRPQDPWSPWIRGCHWNPLRLWILGGRGSFGQSLEAAGALGPVGMHPLDVPLERESSWGSRKHFFQIFWTLLGQLLGVHGLLFVKNCFKLVN